MTLLRTRTSLTVIVVVLVSSVVGVGLGRQAGKLLRAQNVQPDPAGSRKPFTFLTDGKIDSMPFEGGTRYMITLRVPLAAERRLQKFDCKERDSIETDGVIVRWSGPAGTLLEIITLEEVADRYPQLLGKPRFEGFRRDGCRVIYRNGDRNNFDCRNTGCNGRCFLDRILGTCECR